MYTIGQFSRICAVTTKALRHYEEIGLLRPAHTDPFNQYRYYTAEQIEVVQLIKAARETGMSLQLIKAVLAQTAAAKPIDTLLDGQRKMLLQQRWQTNNRLARLDWWQKREEAKQVDKQTAKYAVTLREVGEIQVRSRRDAVTDYPQGVVKMLGELVGEIAQAGQLSSGPPFVLYYDEEYNPERVDVEVAWPVSDAKLATRTIPAVTAITTMHVGSYEGLERAYAALFEWANQNGYEPRYPMRDVYHSDPARTAPEQLVTEVILPVAKK